MKFFFFFMHRFVSVFFLDYDNMILIRRSRRFCVNFFLFLIYFIVLLIFFYCLHYLWCATQDLCTSRYFCRRRQIIIQQNLTQILEHEYSLCSRRSARRGRHQYVIGVSAYLSHIDNKNLLSNIKKYLYEYIEEAKEKYPTWIVRIYYHSLNISKEEIFDIEDRYKNVDFCDSTNIPVFGNILSWMPGKVQRFLPLADPLVDVYMSRDIDSPILDRETVIVRTWLNSEHTIHIIRDHPYHSIPILGGLWGIKLNKEHSLIKNVSKVLLTPDLVRCYTGERDQTFLEEFIWPHANLHRQITLEYDSFHCQKYTNARPFSTRKQSSTTFVGCRRPNCTRDEHLPCPTKCRPANHLDWIWC